MIAAKPIITLRRAHDGVDHAVHGRLEVRGGRRLAVPWDGCGG
jgi:hypothetical protein